MDWRLRHIQNMTAENAHTSTLLCLLLAVKKKKKKNNKKKKKVAQTEPPTIAVSKMFTNQIYPEGELCDYKEEYVRPWLQ